MRAHSKLEYAFLEKAYENALMFLFRREGIEAKQQTLITVSLKKKWLETIMLTFYLPAIRQAGLRIKLF